MNLRIGININGFARLHDTAFQNIPRFLFLASQGSDVGSIPIARSINHDDSIVPTPLDPLKGP